MESGKIASELKRIAAELQYGEPAYRKATVHRLVNKAMSSAAKGLFRDEAWKGVHQVFDALDAVPGIRWHIVKAEYLYGTSASREPTAKQWKLEIEYRDERGRDKTLYGMVTASGAGPVANPLEQYDVTAYAS
jgi:hypothetical protein